MLLLTISLLGIDLAFILFGLTLLGVAIFHNKTLLVALTGLTAILAYQIGFCDFNLVTHLGHEWEILINLFGLLIGFAILADHFEHSGIPGILPRYLPDDWRGGFYLLIMVFVLSVFLDNIAAAMIGGGIASTVFRKRVHIGYIAAIVGASNAGGSGSILGDTTTTMMWIDGVNWLDVTPAYAAAVPALLIFGVIASKQQHKYQPILKDEVYDTRVSTTRLWICLTILVGAIVTNVMLDFPAVGVWVAIFISSFIAQTNWEKARHDMPGSFFLLALVLSASMMPVGDLPPASWQSTGAMGFVSALFDNIPLTKLALAQDGYDWGILAFCVGYGGTMTWFGSSAGVAICNIFPEAKNVFVWIKSGWHVILGYVVGFAIMLAVFGWHPHPAHKEKKTVQAEQNH